MASRSSEPRIAMIHVPMSKNSSRSPMSSALAMKPPRIAPTMPISIVTMIPPGSSPGMIALAIAPATSPRTIQPMIPIRCLPFRGSMSWEGGYPPDALPNLGLTSEVEVHSAGLGLGGDRGGVSGYVGRGRRRSPAHRAGSGGGGGDSACRAERDRDRVSAARHLSGGARGAEVSRRGHVVRAAEADRAEREHARVRGIADRQHVVARSAVGDAHDHVRGGAAPCGEDRDRLDRLAVGELHYVAELWLARGAAGQVGGLDVGSGRDGVVDGDAEAALRRAVAP